MSYLPRVALALSLLSGLVSPCQAQFTLSLTPTSTFGEPGDTLTFAATLTNGTADTIDLIAAGGIVNGPSGGLLWGDSAFLGGLPLSLSPGQSYQNNLFVSVDPSATSGLYTATYTVEGSQHPLFNTLLATESVNITIGSMIPEPGALTLICIALPLCYPIYKRKRTR